MINRIILNGRLAADPEVRFTQSGIAVTNFTIAVDRSYKKENGERDCDFINCVAWRGLAEVIGQWCKKGKRIGVDGSLQMRKYQNKEGENRTVYEVLVQNMDFLDSARSNEDNESQGNPEPDNQSGEPGEQSSSDSGEQIGDLPF